MVKFRRTAGAFCFITTLIACRSGQGLPDPGSKSYRDLVHAFNVGLSGLQSGEDVHAKADLTLATQIAPGEPAAWADLGLLALRQQELDTAWTDMDRARSLAPDNSRIEYYLGDIESRRGKLPEAIAHLKKAIALDAGNLKALYGLAEQTERQATGTSDAEALQYLKTILARAPDNWAVLLDATRLAAKVSDADTLQQAVARLSRASSAWPEEAQAQMKLVEQAASGPDPRQTAIRATFLHNVLLRVPQFRRDTEAVKTPAVFAGEPFVKFLKLPTPHSEPADPDVATTFTPRPLSGMPPDGVLWVRSVYLDESGTPSTMWADAAGLHVSGAATIPANGPLSRNQVAAADLNFDFKTDLVLASAKGLRIYQQTDAHRFTDVTARSHLPKEIVAGSYTGAWPFDVDLDGDLDIVLGVTGAPPVVLRNAGDGTFVAIHPFTGPAGISSFAIADVAGFGAPDVAMIGQDGRLSVFMNQRSGQYQARAVPPDLAAGALAVTAADMDGDGLLDFVVLKNGGTVARLSDKNSATDWDTATLVKTDPGGAASIAVADFDNNGSLDLLVGDGRVYLSGPHGFTRVQTDAGLQSPDVMDVDGDGRLDLIGLRGAPTALLNRGTKNYRWQNVKTQAANVYGDQRINSFGIGGEMEIRAGLLTEKQLITAPVTHFGIGEHTETDVARILWPNGQLQVEFELKPDQAVMAAQRLKGSCPSLFGWNGRQMSFIKDSAPLATGLGEPIARTEEWYKIPGDRIAPRDGYYDLRVTAELWESYYVDYYALLAIDHPRGTEVYTDERYAIPLPPLKLFTTDTPSPFGKVTDDNGRDVTDVVRNVDERYLDTFGRGRYQGVTRDHWVELDLPDDAPHTGPLYLIADGWMHPTDSSVDLALKQSGNAPEEGLRIEVPDANGRWVVAQRNLGFPASKFKTMVLDISSVFRKGAPRKLRLATNMEIYWDRLAWARGLPDRKIATQRLALSYAELLHRGFSKMDAANASSPEVPDYNRLVATGSKWRDIEGYYTRYGDVRELLEKVDDRYAMMAAGDEMRLRFPAPPPPPAGWVRDFMMIGDGWIKDGDYNSAFSRTLTPLPYHGMKDYKNPPGRLEDDPAYKKHPEDWQRFHTRYVGPLSQAPLSTNARP